MVHAKSEGVVTPYTSSTVSQRMYNEENGTRNGTKATVQQILRSLEANEHGIKVKDCLISTWCFWKLKSSNRCSCPSGATFQCSISLVASFRRLCCISHLPPSVIQQVKGGAVVSYKSVYRSRIPTPMYFSDVKKVVAYWMGYSDTPVYLASIFIIGVLSVRFISSIHNISVYAYLDAVNVSRNEKTSHFFRPLDRH